MKRALLVFVFVLFTAAPKAHNVIWWENPDGIPFSPLFAPPPMEIEVYADDLFEDDPPFEVIQIVPDYSFFGPFPVFEPCTVYVTIDKPDPLLGVDIVPNGGFFELNNMLPAILPALEVDVVVYLKDLPPDGAPFHTFISGEWHASGQPDPMECTATNPNSFIVPIDISLTPLAWLIAFSTEDQTVSIDTKKDVALQVSDNVTGPYINIGMGHLFSLPLDGIAKFFRGIKRGAGGLVGTITDPAGKPQSGVSVDLPAGGRNANTDNTGNYTMKFLPFGESIIQFLKTINVPDGNGGSSTGVATIDILVPTIKSYGTLNFKVDFQVIKIPNCPCTPWASIGFGTLDGTQTPIYFSGGANGAKGADCGPIDVTVTPPNGKTFKIRPGSGKHQNSGANPAPGTWTVTTTVCGQSKSATVTFP
jgi:hypothetical protein